MKKSKKIVLGVGSLVAITSALAGCSSDNFNDHEIMEANALESNKDTNKVDTVENDKLSTEKKSEDPSDVVVEKDTVSANIKVEEQPTQTVMTMVETKDSVKTVTKTTDNPPKAKVTVAKKNDTSSQSHTTIQSYIGLVDWMKSNKLDSSVENRSVLAEQYGIENYKGTVEQNTKLLGILNGSITVDKVVKDIKPFSSPVSTQPKVEEDVKTKIPSQSVVEEEKAGTVAKEDKIEAQPQPVQPIEEPSDKVVNEELTPSVPSAPIIEEPVVPEPSTSVEEVEEPVVNEPIEEEPIAEEPSTPTVEEIPVVEETPVVEDTPIEEPIQEEEVQEPVVETPAEPTQPEQPSKPVQEPVVESAPESEVSSISASEILERVGVFTQTGNDYHINDAFGYILNVEVENDDTVGGISFNGTTYYAFKGTTKADLVAALGVTDGTNEYNVIQQEIKNIESGVRAVSNAVYGSGTSHANGLYNEILESGSNGFYREF